MVLQCAGTGYRLMASVLKSDFALSGHSQHLALRYTHALITRIAQTAACNRHHSLERPLWCWLLLMLDSLPGGELVITLQLIANMLVVCREDDTEVAGQIQKPG